MLSVKPYTELSLDETNALSSYLDVHKDEILPYQTIAFLNLVDQVFGYKNVSLVAFRNNGAVCGFIPQWKKGTVVESVPWRDKGGPIFDTEDALDALRSETLHRAKKTGATGVLWKDFCDPEFTQRAHFINVDIESGKFDTDAYWKALSSKVRGKIRQARKNNLRFRVLDRLDEYAIQVFYRIFVENRRRLGVPTYSADLFRGYFRHFSHDNIKLCEVFTDKNQVVSSLILLHNGQVAIDAYSASTEKGLRFRANDLMIFSVVTFCMEKGIKKFDFGADSPLQETLIEYKTKWLGQTRSITSSTWGNVKEIDINRKVYNIARSVLRHLPLWPYRLASTVLVR